MMASWLLAHWCSVLGHAETVQPVPQTASPGPTRICVYSSGSAPCMSFCSWPPLPAGSMYGSREVVAKAVALECMRGAHRQQRRCYLYAFRWAGASCVWG